MRSRLLPATAVVALLATVPATAGAATFKVVKAQHRSTAVKADGDYSGRSTATWALARPGRIAINRAGTAVTGLASLAVRGSYAIDASTSRAHCAWTAATGAGGDYAALAPTELSLMVAPDPRTGKGVIASFAATRATLGNAYLPSECSTSMSGEPAPEETSSRRIRPADLRRKRLTLRYQGATTREGIAYTWSTVIVLVRR